MSDRRDATVSPLTGCPWKASPVAVQSASVPVSKSRLSGLPFDPIGRVPGRSAAKTSEAEARRIRAVFMFLCMDFPRSSSPWRAQRGDGHGKITRQGIVDSRALKTLASGANDYCSFVVGGEF